MNVAVYLRVAAPSQQLIADAVVEGCRKLGDTAYRFSYHDGPLRQDADVVVLFGIGGDAKLVYDVNRAAKKRTVLLDKPYIRAVRMPDAPRYHLLRVVVDGFQPLRYCQLTPKPADRWNALHIEVKPYAKRAADAPILFDGASNKYIQWCELGNGQGTGLEQWAEWGQRMVNTIWTYGHRPILYRPRPSHNPPQSVHRAELSTGRLEEDFDRCGLVVSHGGNIGFDAVVRGIPHFAIGDSIARPLSETAWPYVGVPKIPDEQTRQQWLYDLAYCQWNLDEFRNGTAWNYIRETIKTIDAL